MYEKLASSDNPATILFLIDISGSMQAPMAGGKTRLEVAKDAIQTTYTSMIQRSLRQGVVHSRYRVGMIAYSDFLYDIYGTDPEKGSFLSIQEIQDQEIPALTPQKWTNMAKAFRYAAKLLTDDIARWPDKWLQECPAPMVINVTDCEFSEYLEDPLTAANDLQRISIPDGNVLVENVFITDEIRLASSDLSGWKGYMQYQSTGDPFGDKLLAMSSKLPAGYAEVMREQTGLVIQEGAAMFFPGINPEFVKAGFVMSVVSGFMVKRRIWEEPDPPIDERVN